jgi:hypothetical protein
MMNPLKTRAARLLAGRQVQGVGLPEILQNGQIAVVITRAKVLAGQRA